MTELDHLLEVHRREDRRAQALADCVVLALFLVGYGVYRLIGVLL